MKTIDLTPYKTLHLWLFLPLLIMQAGIFMDYWPGFSEKPWGIHVHYWTGTLWFILMITQAWLATHKRLKDHRTWGMIGFFIGGGAVFSALSLNARHIQSAIDFDFPGFYGLIVAETTMIAAFMLAILTAIVKRKNFQEHFWWLSASLFYILFPAVDRGINQLLPLFEIEMFGFYIAVPFIISCLLFFAWKHKKLRHPATWLGVGVNIIPLFMIPIGNIPGIEQFMISVFKS